MHVKNVSAWLYLAHLTCPDCIYTPPCNDCKLTPNSFKFSDVSDTRPSIQCEQPRLYSTDLQYEIEEWMIAFMKDTNWYPGLVQKVVQDDFQIQVMFPTRKSLDDLYLDLKLPKISSTKVSCVRF